MKNFWFWLVVVLVFLCAATATPPVKAQSGVSPNLVYMTTNPWPGTAGTNPGSWTNNFTTTTGNGGGVSGGNQPAYNQTTGTFMFGYTTTTIAYTYALSQALKDSGMTWTGYNYSWDYINQDYTRGTLSANLGFNGENGTSVYSKSWTLGPTTGGWTTISGTETFTTGALASTISNFKLSFTGKDDRFWAGYYGPQVKNPSLTINYTFDACSTNPLSSPSCPGYAAAYLTQQCNANPLYDASCPGYAQALLTQQCNANPLSNPQCPGYATAYLNYQCSVNPLYSTTCAGYQQAYHDEQCSANPLYDKTCSGYSQAYALKYVVVTPTTTSTTTTTTTTSTTSNSETTTVAIVSDPVVNQVVTTTATSASPAQSATATVPLVQTPTTTSPAAISNTTTAKEEKKDATSTSVSSTTPTQTASTETKGDAKPTARQELQAKREAAAKAKAVEEGKNLASNMGKASDIESQKQIQNVVIQAMGFTPGFDTYNKAMIPDTVGYKPYSVYNNQKTVDNRRLGMGLYGPSERLHNDLVDLQYKE